MQHEASVLVDLAKESHEIYKFFISELAHTCQLAIVMKTDLQISDEITPLESSKRNVNEMYISKQVNEAPQLTIGNPHISQTKGRKKDREKLAQNCRFKSGLEVSHDKSLVKRKLCHTCGEHGHNSKSCKEKKTRMITLLESILTKKNFIIYVIFYFNFLLSQLTNVTFMFTQVYGDRLTSNGVLWESFI